jgi:hypothetical protein
MAATPLTVRRPSVGDEVIAFGYANLDAHAEAPDRVVIEPVLHVAKGTVTADRITPRYEKRAFPALEADFPFPSGMSGGPVIVAAREDGELFAPGTGVCAVCSSSIPPFDDSDSWTSWAALVAPAFALEVESNLDGEIATRTVHELAQKQVVVTDGTHDQVFVTDDDPRTVGWVDRDADPSA